MSMRKTGMTIIAMVLMSGVVLTASAEDSNPKPERVEIRHSMLGYRDTVVFYTFKEQRAVMVLNIGNSDETFPITGSVHLYDKATTEKDLKKWINNQHSDALFGDAPEPLVTRKLPAGFCKVTSREQAGTSENRGPSKGTFKDFKVVFSIKEQVIGEDTTLPAFIDTAQVHVRSQ